MTQVLSVKVHDDLASRVVSLAERLGVSKSEAHRRLLARGLDAYPSDVSADGGPERSTPHEGGEVVDLKPRPARLADLEARLARLEAGCTRALMEKKGLETTGFSSSTNPAASVRLAA